MAIQRDIVAADNFFLGEDKILEFTVFGPDGMLNVGGLPLEWNMRKTDKAGDPAILTKGIGTGLTIIGSYNAVPATNTQRVDVTFVPADTIGLKPNVAYRHSLKRKDANAEEILSFGAITFLQAG
jgi:hypothetical protein